MPLGGGSGGGAGVKRERVRVPKREREEGGGGDSVCVDLTAPQVSQPTAAAALYLGCSSVPAPCGSCAAGKGGSGRAAGTTLGIAAVFLLLLPFSGAHSALLGLHSEGKSIAPAHVHAPASIPSPALLQPPSQPPPRPLVVNGREVAPGEAVVCDLTEDDTPSWKVQRK